MLPLETRRLYPSDPGIELSRAKRALKLRIAHPDMGCIVVVDARSDR